MNQSDDTQQKKNKEDILPPDVQEEVDTLKKKVDNVETALETIVSEQKK